MDKGVNVVWVDVPNGWTLKSTSKFGEPGHDWHKPQPKMLGTSLFFQIQLFSSCFTVAARRSRMCLSSLFFWTNNGWTWWQLIHSFTFQPPGDLGTSCRQCRYLFRYLFLTDKLCHASYTRPPFFRPKNYLLYNHSHVLHPFCPTELCLQFTTFRNPAYVSARPSEKTTR